MCEGRNVQRHLWPALIALLILMSTITRVRLSMGLVLVMLAQSLTGPLIPDQYRDVEWIKATWVGNDWITLVAAVPLLIVGMAGAARGSARGTLLWLGTIAYAEYNYLFYLFGAALNAFFLLYVAAVVLAMVILVVALARLDVAVLAQRFHFATPVRTVGGALVCVGVGLAAVRTGSADARDAGTGNERLTGSPNVRRGGQGRCDRSPAPVHGNCAARASILRVGAADQEVAPDQRLEDETAGGIVERPQTTGLRMRDLKARHLQVLTLDSNDERFMSGSHGNTSSKGDCRLRCDDEPAHRRLSRRRRSLVVSAAPPAGPPSAQLPSRHC